jgi:hypothetical protein
VAWCRSKSDAEWPAFHELGRGFHIHLTREIQRGAGEGTTPPALRLRRVSRRSTNDTSLARRLLRKGLG